MKEVEDNFVLVKAVVEVVVAHLEEGGIVDLVVESYLVVPFLVEVVDIVDCQGKVAVDRVEGMVEDKVAVLQVMVVVEVEERVVVGCRIDDRSMRNCRGHKQGSRNYIAYYHSCRVDWVIAWDIVVAGIDFGIDLEVGFGIGRVRDRWHCRRS